MPKWNLNLSSTTYVFLARDQYSLLLVFQYPFVLLAYASTRAIIHTHEARSKWFKRVKGLVGERFKSTTGSAGPRQNME